MKKYKTSSFDNEIHIIDTSRETDNFIYKKKNIPKPYMTNREIKASKYYKYFDTFQEAKDELLERTRFKLECIKKDLNKYQKIYNKIKEYKE